MNEDLLQFIWSMQLLETNALFTSDNEKIEILQAGTLNTNAGPDFLHAKIKIGDTIWAGHIEIHIKASDWKLHAHQTDPAFNNVILHVVLMDDGYDNGIPVLELNGKIPGRLLNKYAAMMQTAAWIPCEKHINQFSEIKWKSWLQRLTAERLEQKALHIEERLHYNKNDWEETCYQLIARSFGAPINSDAMEQVANALPLKTILRHKNDSTQVEALIFGTAGFLESSYKELYPHKLQSEYRFLKNKFELIAPSLQWKFSRLRPASFPTIRLSQLAALICKTDALFDKLILQNDVKKMESVFAIHPGEYWKEHYHFKKAAKVSVSGLGKSTIQIILMNTVAPIKYLYGLKNGKQEMIDDAIALLEKLKPEKNSIIANWAQLGFTAMNAAESQAMIQLKKEYCDNRNCLHCHVGYFVLGMQE
ncbi:MAG: DUF2851 family protein [Bacteroidetes bacterium]|nr:DUF2851 family protein [Bacteroidota bacterium]